MQCLCHCPKNKKPKLPFRSAVFFSEKLDSELSEIQAGFLLDYFFKEIAPFAYNQGVADAQKYLLRTGEDLLGTCFQEPLTYWETGTDSIRRKPES
jgi:uncharacterized protein (DUF2164 family)